MMILQQTAWQKHLKTSLYQADALKILQEYYDGKDIELNEARLRMARIPETAELIDNPISAAPGMLLKTFTSWQVFQKFFNLC